MTPFYTLLPNPPPMSEKLLAGHPKEGMQVLLPPGEGLGRGKGGHQLWKYQ
jgi:hypothetical protein